MVEWVKNSSGVGGTNNYAVADTHITASGDTVLPASGVAMLVFPDSGGYANNDYIGWEAGSTFDITSPTGGLYSRNRPIKYSLCQFNEQPPGELQSDHTAR